MEDWLIGGLVIHAGADLWADVTVQGFFLYERTTKISRTQNTRLRFIKKALRL